MSFAVLLSTGEFKLRVFLGMDCRDPTVPSLEHHLSSGAFIGNVDRIIASVDKIQNKKFRGETHVSPLR